MSNMCKRIYAFSLVAACMTLAMTGCSTRPARFEVSPGLKSESRAVAFLQREVPAWSRENGCFSCHNNGDAARALYAASRKGYRIPKNVLADTTAWVSHPERWDDNKGDPGFSDQRLADLQFAASLAAAVKSGAVKSASALKTAVIKVAKAQAADGSWPIEASNPIGSPATHGTTLATYLAWDLLNRNPAPETSVARQKAENRIQAVKPDTVPNAAVLLLFASSLRSHATDNSANARTKASPPPFSDRESSLEFLRRAQTSDGGWGPYADSPPEAFDTALALLALADFRSESEVPEMIQRGRKFLVATQWPDGSWSATTRPSGGQSYAQQISTAGWATLALLATR